MTSSCLQGLPFHNPVYNTSIILSCMQVVIIITVEDLAYWVQEGLHPGLSVVKAWASSHSLLTIFMVGRAIVSMDTCSDHMMNTSYSKLVK